MNGWKNVICVKWACNGLVRAWSNTGNITAVVEHRMLPYDPDDQELKAMFHVISHEQQGVGKSNRKWLHRKMSG